MSQLTPTSYPKRIAAFTINFLIGSLLVSIPKYLEIDDELKQRLPMLIGLAFILTFTMIPESPGKRLLGLQTLDLEKNPISAKKRWIRNSVYLAYFTAMSFLYFLPPFDLREMGTSIFWLIPTHMLIPLFMMANGLTVFMNPSGQSLIDMRTKSQTYGYVKPKGILKAY
ncbi:hypothetical protein VDG1235_1357 [Verrucomicrobiia bacterium DG1235]|nr:hypothetical protein VDG1235_1357 [Verrucomicrobiae bacterium DG1235]